MDKKLVFGLLVLLIGLMSVPVHAQTTQQHIIIIVKENRTPDNLFSADTALRSQGAELQSLTSPAKCEGSTSTYLQPYPNLDACFNPNHDHGPAPTLTNPGGGFEGAYDGGAWDGACLVPTSTSNCSPVPSGILNYTYVGTATRPDTILEPYFQIAEQYGFSNYMFQTNQGPSYIAHQFLFSGTSAPVPYNDMTGLWTWFPAENAKNPVGDRQHQGGCGAPMYTTVLSLNSAYTGVPWQTESTVYTPPGSTLGFPCYNHSSMADLLDAGGVSWKYYIQYNSIGWSNSIWTAPNLLTAICGTVSGGVCTGSEYTNHVKDTTGEVLTDIDNPCQRPTGSPTCSATTCTYNLSTNPNALPDVSWVIPDGAWSDHPGDPGSDGGPSWVAAIVNAIGAQSRGYPYDCGYWGGVNNTTILIVWDDWGGWYDHVAPWLPTVNGVAGGYLNPPPLTGATDGDWYVYGFRVPLLVVSAYVNGNCTGSPCTGYISGTTSQGGETPPYIHDFGSILGFVEYTFGLPPYPPIPGVNTCGIEGFTDSSCSYPYADYFAPDGEQECTTIACGSTPYPLMDFFAPSGTPPRTFTTITGAKYSSSCFTSASNASSCFGSNFPSDADDEDD